MSFDSASDFSRTSSTRARRSERVGLKSDTNDTRDDGPVSDFSRTPSTCARRSERVGLKSDTDDTRDELR